MSDNEQLRNALPPHISSHHATIANVGILALIAGDGLGVSLALLLAALEASTRDCDRPAIVLAKLAEANGTHKEAENLAVTHRPLRTEEMHPETGECGIRRKRGLRWIFPAALIEVQLKDLLQAVPLPTPQRLVIGMVVAIFNARTPPPGVKRRETLSETRTHTVMVLVLELHETSCAVGCVDDSRGIYSARLTLVGIIDVVGLKEDAAGHHLRIQLQGARCDRRFHRLSDLIKDFGRESPLLCAILVRLETHQRHLRFGATFFGPRCVRKNAAVLLIVILIIIATAFIAIDCGHLPHLQKNALPEVALPLLIRDGGVQAASQTEALHSLLQPRAIGRWNVLQKETAAMPKMFERAAAGASVYIAASLPLGSGDLQ
mmetsp:Transcript_109748/g.245099  ORF Transcript_109748/g.245099 Transcript_109748/m.245099 type:complete len:376 (+) Transcript_109748:44-1171(+)